MESNIDLTMLDEKERIRTENVMKLVLRGRKSVLDVGCRDGRFSRLLTERFESVTALDINEPQFAFPRVVTVKGDVRKLQFESESFDCVFCVEVLEHVPDVEAACRELVRVAREEIVIGVPFRQDIRIGRTTCACCGKTNPPFGHVNTFDLARLQSLFPGLTVAAESYVGSNRAVTNALSTFLMDLAGNPWGTYSQQEPCMYCEAKLVAPDKRTLRSRLLSAAALRARRAQEMFARPHGNWIHVVFRKSENGKRKT